MNTNRTVIAGTAPGDVRSNVARILAARAATFEGRLDAATEQAPPTPEVDDSDLRAATFLLA